MNVVILTHYSALYGANQSMLDFISGAKENGFKFLVVSSERGMLDIELEKLEIQVVHVKMYRLFYSDTATFLKSVLKYFIQFHVRRNIVNRISSFKPNLIYSNSSVITIGDSISRKMKIPHLWHVREFRTTDYNMHYLLGESRLKRLLNRADKVVAISNAVMESIMPEVTQDKIVKIYNGVLSKVEVKNYPARTIVANKVLVYGVVGIIRASKGQLDAVLSLIQLKEKYGLLANLIFFGQVEDQSYFEKIKQLIKRHDLEEYVTFKGFEIDKNKLYKSLDVLLVCSLKEGFGRVTTEAMFRGIPVIGRDSGGTAEIISKNESGLLYSDIESLTEAMKDISSDPHFYARLGQGAKTRAIEKYSREEYVESLSSLIKSLD